MIKNVLSTCMFMSFHGGALPHKPRATQNKCSECNENIGKYIIMGITGIKF